MKTRFTIAVILLASALFVAGVNIAQAQWSAIKTGYAVTTNWHGKDVPIGQSVTVTAGTTDSTIKTVEFRWKDPAESVVWVIVVPVSKLITPAVPPSVPQEVIDWATKNPGITYWYAQDTRVPYILGDWGVQAFFNDKGKIMKGKGEDYVAIRATSFHIVPEASTIVVLLSMFGALGIFALKKKHSFPIRMSS